MIELYPHQEDLVGETAMAFREHRSVLMQAPTGSGKTVLGACIAQRASAKGNRLMFCVHRRNLIKQTAQTMTNVGLEYGLIAAGHTPDHQQPVQIASIDTLRNRLDRVPLPDLLVIDEAHMAAAQTWRKVVKYYREQGSRVLGLSATPSRCDGKPLSDLFDYMVQGPPVHWLMEHGYLSSYVAYAPSAPDLSGVRTTAGDYARGELADAVDKPKLTGDAAKHYRKLAMNTRAICYCASIKHSEHVCEHFNKHGIPAVHIDGKTPRDVQAQAIRDFADGKYLVLCNVELITTGFDLSSQVGRDVPVETIIMLRPTQSEALCLQMIGRGLRRKPNPAIILDHSGNLFRHGLPDQERDWTLESAKKQRAKSEDTPVPIRQCPECYFCHPPNPTCPQCGHTYEVKSREIEYVEGELQQIEVQRIRMKEKREQGSARSVEDLEALGRARGYKNPRAWAYFVHQARRRKSAA